MKLRVLILLYKTVTQTAFRQVKIIDVPYLDSEGDEVLYNLAWWLENLCPPRHRVEVVFQYVR